MVYSNSVTKDGIVEETRFLVGANETSYPIADITRNVNRWLDKAVSLIYRSAGRWQWDDSNQTDYAIATADLTSNQQDYPLDVSFLRIERVEIKRADGSWAKLQPIDLKDKEQAVSGETTGEPVYYDMRANSIFLFPAPNYSQDDSLKVYTQRPSTYFTVSDTTKVAGIASIFHRYLSLGAGFDYALKNNLTNRNQLREEIVQMEDEMKTFYTLRQPDESIRLINRNSGKRLYK